MPDFYDMPDSPLTSLCVGGSYWDHVPMRRVAVSVDPDREEQTVVVPEIWDENSARGLLALSGGESQTVRFTAQANYWLNKIDCRAKRAQEVEESREAREFSSLANSLACLLLLRQAAPTKSVWRGSAFNEDGRENGFSLKLSAFVEEGEFNVGYFTACLLIVCRALRAFDERDGGKSVQMQLFDLEQSTGDATQGESCGTIWLTDLDAALAQMGLNYDSPQARRFAQSAAALTRLAGRLGTKELPPLPYPDSAPKAWRAAARSLLETELQDSDRKPIACGFSAPNEGEALLGVETCGLAPAFSILDAEGKLSESAQARLYFAGLTPDKALAMAMEGDMPLAKPSYASHEAMIESVRDYVDFVPEIPDAELQARLVDLKRGVRRSLPERRHGFSQRSSINGHDLFLRAQEFEDGTLGEVDLVPLKESPLAKGLMQCFSQAVSLGLQYGAPLEAYVERFAHSQFAPAGMVTGDPHIRFATSMLDYAFRALSEAYLGKPIPDAPTLPGVAGLERGKSASQLGLLDSSERQTGS